MLADGLRDAIERTRVAAGRKRDSLAARFSRRMEERCESLNPPVEPLERSPLETAGFLPPCKAL